MTATRTPRRRLIAALVTVAAAATATACAPGPGGTTPPVTGVSALTTGPPFGGSLPQQIAAPYVCLPAGAVVSATITPIDPPEDGPVEFTLAVEDQFSSLHIPASATITTQPVKGGCSFITMSHLRGTQFVPPVRFSYELTW
ncbi:MAG: hypothetical protein ACYC2O_07360 [Microthrixaceae bacterium]